MRYIQIPPSPMEEMEYLEKEVHDEMYAVDAETSFTTQKKVYTFLVEDLEAHTISLSNELKLYREQFQRQLDELHSEISCLKNDLGVVNSENQQLHDMLVFYGNQFNQCASNNVSSSSLTSCEDSSVLLETIFDELKRSSNCDDVTERRVQDAITSIQQSVSPIVSDPDPRREEISDRDHHTAEDECEHNDVVETLTENIMLKDRLLKHLEDEIEDQNDVIESLLKQNSMFFCESVRNDTVNMDESEVVSILESPTETETEPNLASIQSTPIRSTLVETNETNIPNNKVRSGLINRGLENLADIHPWERHSNGFSRRIFTKYGYNGGGLGKDEMGIATPVSVSKHSGRGGIGVHRVSNPVKEWPKGTVLIIGDSIIGGILEDKLSRYKVKVRSNPGACIDDIYDYIAPLLRKKPTYIILHVGTNDATSKSSRKIYTEITNLRSYIEDCLPETKVIISCPVLRTDNQKANRTLQEVDSKLKGSNFDLVVNDNITDTHLGKKGLHLNDKGSGSLAVNFINHIKRL